NTFKEKNELQNIIKIPLQPVPYAHVATFPEKLIETLLSFGVPENGMILDPFGGSGTTCKAVQNLNEKSCQKMSSIMIEANSDFIKIIQERCNIPKKNIFKVNFKKYQIHPLKNDFKSDGTVSNATPVFDFESNHVLIKILKTSKEYQDFIPLLFDQNFHDKLEDEIVMFVGLPDHDIKKILEISNTKSWIPRNILIVPKDHDWIPILMLVKNVKSIKYRFNIDAIRVGHKTEILENWSQVDFEGYKVLRTRSFFKTSKKGVIIKVISKKSNGLPHWVVVKWQDNEITLEEVINYPLEERFVKFYCPECQKELSHYYHAQNEVTCENCGLKLWQDLNGIPNISLNPRNPPEINLKKIKMNVKEKSTRKKYDGKFKNMDRINLGQSPGARASVFEQYFSVQRYYDVNQGLACDYFNLHRKKKRMTKKNLTERFPPSYKHTVGHWLRKDMGGSIPKVEDLLKLQEILDLDDSYVFYMSRMGLKLQTVLVNSKGKNPGDFLDMSLPEAVEMLKKLAN
ncbi:MAG: DNA methyltransferase, partial [Candidatus Helarchaeales archaeon]